MDGKYVNAMGYNAEKFYEQYFKRIGYDECETVEKKGILDNVGIDLKNIPFNIQIKSGVQKRMNPGKVLLLMNTNVKASGIKDIKKNHCFVIHRKKSFTKSYNLDIIYMFQNTFDYYNNLLEDKITPLSIKKREGFENDIPVIGVSVKEFEIFFKMLVDNE